MSSVRGVPSPYSSALYPLLGAIFVVQHSLLWSRLVRGIGKFAGLSVALLVLLYTGGWRLQGPVVSGVLGRGWLGSAGMQALLAGEAALAMYLLLGWALAGNTDQLFDEVMALRGVKQVKPLSSDEQKAINAAAAAVKRKDTAAAKRGSLSRWLMRLPLRAAGRAWGHYFSLLTAPLLAVPLLGWAAYLYLNGQATGADVHAHYFARKGLKDHQQQQVIVENSKISYTIFGAVSFLFNLVPVANYALYYGNIAGAALWAADLEASQATLYDPMCNASNGEYQRSDGSRRKR